LTYPSYSRRVIRVARVSAGEARSLSIVRECVCVRACGCTCVGVSKCVYGGVGVF